MLQRKDNYVTVSYTWDGLDRVLTTTAQNAQDGTSVAYAFTYDEDGAIGRLTSVVEPERTVRFEYVEGRLATERVEESGVATALVTDYRYDAAGRRSELVYPTGLRLAYDRDAVSGEVVALRNAETGEVYAGSVARLAGGPIGNLAFANGSTLAQGYNARWEATSVVTGPVSLAYTPTLAGDVGGIVENGTPLHFTYDFLDRLTEMTGGDGEGFRHLYATNQYYPYETYDRISRTDANTGSGYVARYAYVYDYQTNVSGIARYDAAGTRIVAAVCLRHDPLGRLVTVGTASPGYIAPDGVACQRDSPYVTAVTDRIKYDFRNRRVATLEGGDRRVGPYGLRPGRPAAG